MQNVVYPITYHGKRRDNTPPKSGTQRIEQAVAKLSAELQVRHYSPEAIRSYSNSVRDFLGYRERVCSTTTERTHP